MKFYQYNGDIYCESCVTTIQLLRKEAQFSEDSMEYPQEIPNIEYIEFDTPQCCVECEEFARNRLTEDGIEWLRGLLDQDDTPDEDSPARIWQSYYQEYL